MRLLDQDSSMALKNLILFLTANEAREVIDGLQDLLEKQDGHTHISDNDLSHEITLVIYDPENLDGLHERSKKLILDDI